MEKQREETSQQREEGSCTGCWASKPVIDITKASGDGPSLSDKKPHSFWRVKIVSCGWDPCGASFPLGSELCPITCSPVEVSDCGCQDSGLATAAVHGLGMFGIEYSIILCKGEELQKCYSNWSTAEKCNARIGHPVRVGVRNEGSD